MIIINDSYIAALTVQPKEYGISIPQTTGLYLKVRPSGAKVFAMKVKRKGITKNKQLGNFPSISLLQAKQLLARELNILDCVAVQDLALDNSLSAVLSRYEVSPRFLKLGHKSQLEYSRYLNEFTAATRSQDASAVLSDRKLINELLSSIAGSGKHVKANRMKSAISSFCWFAMDSGVTITNPTVGLMTYQESSRERVLSDNELRMLFLYLNSAECKASPLTKDSIRLYLLMGNRLNELRQMHSSEFDGEGIWRLPKERVKKAVKDSVTPITATTALILSNYPKEGFILRQNGRLMGNETVSQALGRICSVLGIEKVTTHDLRRTAGTLLAKLRVDALIRKRVLNHRIADVTDDVYTIWDWHDEKLAALAKLEGHLLSLGILGESL
jgi:integrase